MMISSLLCLDILLAGLTVMAIAASLRRNVVSNQPEAVVVPVKVRNKY